tara:strand:+ start:179 stop:415 length:237 start_codon:yes stop_codon:yes gene_type:complete
MVQGASLHATAEEDYYYTEEEAEDDYYYTEEEEDLNTAEENDGGHERLNDFRINGPSPWIPHGDLDHSNYAENVEELL